MMKKIPFLFALTACIATGLYSQTTKRALFLGNSYTAVNNLPLIVSSLATSAGDTLIFDSNTPGGYTFQDHTTNVNSINKIMMGSWDYVVLQEQSQLPSFPIDQVEAEVFPYAQYLDSVINQYNPCGETMFYMTWGRKNGDAANCPYWPPVCTYTGMDSLLHLRYMMMAEDNHAVVSPVGAVWNYLRTNFPLIELYQPDESHPSLAGSYAAACCFYSSIFRKNPELITDDYGIPAVDAANIRAAVKAVVYDNFLEWHIGEYDPVADFNVTADGYEVTLTNLSLNATDYTWDFGDGHTSTETEPVHTYAAAGTYTITLIAEYCDYTDTVEASVTIISTGIQSDLETILKLYPNPVSDQLTIHISAFDYITLVNALGQNTVPDFTIAAGTTTIDFSDYSPGMYLLVIAIDGEIYSGQVIKQE